MRPDLRAVFRQPEQRLIHNATCGRRLRLDGQDLRVRANTESHVTIYCSVAAHMLAWHAQVAQRDDDGGLFQTLGVRTVPRGTLQLRCDVRSR